MLAIDPFSSLRILKEIDQLEMLAIYTKTNEDRLKSTSIEP